jgi:hypothetical protein
MLNPFSERAQRPHSAHGNTISTATDARNNVFNNPLKRGFLAGLPQKTPLFSPFLKKTTCIKNDILLSYWDISFQAGFIPLTKR